jgi:hypothetical protein
MKSSWSGERKKDSYIISGDPGGKANFKEFGLTGGEQVDKFKVGNASYPSGTGPQPLMNPRKLSLYNLPDQDLFVGQHHNRFILTCRSPAFPLP